MSDRIEWRDKVLGPCKEPVSEVSRSNNEGGGLERPPPAAPAGVSRD